MNIGKIAKQCYSCKQYFDLDSFPSDKDKKDGKSSYCFDCKRKQEFAYRQMNKVRRTEQYIDRRIRIIKENRQKLREYLHLHPCVDCGETDMIVLEFDHLKDKKQTISKMMTNGLCWERILEEMEKCEVVCSNDHARRTARQFGWWKAVD